MLSFDLEEDITSKADTAKRFALHCPCQLLGTLNPKLEFGSIIWGKNKFTFTLKLVVNVTSDPVNEFPTD